MKLRSNPKLLPGFIDTALCQVAWWSHLWSHVWSHCTEVKRDIDESKKAEIVEKFWANFWTALNEAATKLLSTKKRVNKPWIAVGTLALIMKRADLQLRKHSSALALLEFSNYCKRERKALRSDKRQWLKDKGETKQDLSDKDDLKEVFGQSKQLCQNRSPQPK